MPRKAARAGQRRCRNLPPRGEPERGPRPRRRTASSQRCPQKRQSGDGDRPAGEAHRQSTGRPALDRAKRRCLIFWT